MSAKLSAIYRNAALHHLHSAEGAFLPGKIFSCHSVQIAATGSASGPSHPATSYYREYFGQPKVEDGPLSGGWFCYNDYPSLSAMQEHRCLALLLMSEIAKDMPYPKEWP